MLHYVFYRSQAYTPTRIPEDDEAGWKRSDPNDLL